MKSLRWVYILFLVIAVGVNLDGKDLRLRLYSTDDGLSNSNVNDIIQDRNGFIWIATSNGLNRFDGSNFMTILHGRQVRCIYEDSEGNIWAGMLEGKVCRYDPRTSITTDYVCYFPTESTNGDVSGIIESKDGFIWIAVDRLGLVRLNPETGGHVRFDHDPEDPESLSNNAVTDLEFDDDGKLWISTWGGGLNVFDPADQSFSFPMERLGLQDGQYADQFKILKRPDGIWWVGTTFSGAVRYDSRKNELTRYSANNGQLASNAVMDMEADKSGNIWIGTPDGIDIIESGSGKTWPVSAYINNRPFKSFGVTCLYCDRDNSIWMGTSSGVLFYNSRLSTFNTCSLSDDPSGSGNCFSALKDRSGRVWICDKRGLTRLTYRPDGTVQEENLTSRLPSRLARTLFEDSKGAVWISYNNDMLSRYDPATNQLRNFTLRTENESGLPFRDINSIYEDADGTMWLGGEVGLMNFDPQSGKCTDIFRSKTLIYPNEKVVDIIRDNDGNLWVATHGGILKYGEDLSLISRFTADSGSTRSISSNWVNCILQDSNGTIWAGTSNGLDKYVPGENTFVLTQRPGEDSGDQVAGIIEDNNRRLWILTGLGLMSYGLDDNSLRIFNRDDGLLGNIFVKAAFQKASDGEIIIGGVNGVNRFYPEAVNVSVADAPVFIEEFQIFNKTVQPGEGSPLEKSIEYTDEIHLSYKESMISFQFAAIDFITPHKKQYEYIFEGVDDDWISTSSNKRYASYTNLKPGTYTFKVRVKGDEAACGQSSQVRVVIRPPFWATWWAYVVYVLMAGGLVASAMAFSLRRQKLRNKHEMDELKLKLFTNISHEFRTSLTLILGPLDYLLGSDGVRDTDKSMLSMMKGNANRLLRLVNQLLDFRKVEARKMTVNNSTQDIVAFIRDVFDLFTQYAKEKELEYSFSSVFAEHVMDFDKDKVDKVVYNLLSNAFKYTDKGGKVNVTLDSTEKAGAVFVSVKVSDNGIGMSEDAMANLFNRFYQAPDREARFRGGSGLGLNMTWELVKLMGGDISVESAIGEGSEFTVLLPVVVPENNLASECESATEECADTAEELVSGPDEMTRDTVLIVEDNLDMQAYIRTVLKNTFDTVSASNGAEGLEKAVEIMPDIIISDVMMPVMDGITFFTEIKEDERTRHIPVIMLSAVTDENQIAESFKIGVDGYMTKPFSPAVLLAKIENVLSRHREDRKTSVSGKNPFSEKLIAVINDNLADSSFGVEQLCREMGVSPAQLSRKTKENCNMTPYGLIIKMRMDLAVRLVKETDLNISEIAFRCGYQELSNFSRAFTKYWDESPTRMMKKLRSRTV